MKKVGPLSPRRNTLMRKGKIVRLKGYIEDERDKEISRQTKKLEKEGEETKSSVRFRL